MAAGRGLTRKEGLEVRTRGPTGSNTGWWPAVLLSFAVAVPASGAVYQWVDDKGKIYFGDRPPASTEATDKSGDYGERRRFEVAIETAGYVLDADIRTRIKIAMKKIHGAITIDLGVGLDKDPNLVLIIHGTRESYQATRAPGARSEMPSAGYYSPARKEMVVWKNRSPERMLRTITHEVTHAILGHRYSRMPAWLNEGLAEYFEQIQPYGLAVRIPPSSGWDRLIRARLNGGTLLSLREYVSLDNREWYARNQPDFISYAQGWSLVFFLMSSDAGRALVSKLLDELATQDPASFDAAGAMDRHHSGGLPDLESRWRLFVVGDKPAHHY